MADRRIIVGLATGALVAAGIVCAPAFGATEQERTVRRTAPAPRGLGSFTPSSADPRLAALFARSGVDGRSFRFTPAEAKGARGVTVAVRARTARPVAVAAVEKAADVAPTVGIAPIAYNLGVAVGWRRFALSGDVARVDTAGQPGGREGAEVGVSYTLEKFSGRVKAVADRPTADAPRLVDGTRSYALDVGGSYSLTRNLDVTAGVRYRSDRERITRLDDRRDSQAVYLGTAFKF